MRFSFKYMGGLAIMLSLFSCMQEEKSTVKPFQDVLNMEAEVKTLNGGLVKYMVKDSIVELNRLGSPNWDVELKPFFDADFNTPANKDNYSRTETISSLSGWRDVIWIRKKDNLPVKSAVYRFKNDDCVSAQIEVVKESAVYTNAEFLTFIPNVGYAIENEQTINGLSNSQFNLTGEFVGNPQPWRMFFDIGNGNVVPVNFEFQNTKGAIELTFIQGSERIKMKAVKTDSNYRVEIPIFQAFLTFELEDEVMKGNFHNLDKGDDYFIPFSALKLPYSSAVRSITHEEGEDFSGKWEVYFREGEDKTAAIGMFDRLGDDLFGTFATETGDYRYLQGKVFGNEFSLSTFDGAHLFLFTGKISGDIITEGHFYSGSHYHAKWDAKRNNDVELLNPDEMTSLKDGVEKVDFSFPNLSGESVSLSDDTYQNKVVILQILGSWCPNCMDETRYFNELYSKYNSQGLEIIGLAFERSKDFEIAKLSLEKAITDLNVSYSMLIAGTPKESALALPMFTPIKSYPTSIIIDRYGNVIQIHTGFYGPGTGKYYEEYTFETEKLLEDLLEK
jgi:thiol-disulfide isomerase/thioredoxin